MSRKLIVNDGKRQRELLLVGTMVVGRDPSCDISEADPLLSRRHVEFVSGAIEVVVRDLGSRNGILINGVKTTQAILRPGDMVQVGHLQVTFVEDAAPISASVSPVDDDATALMAPPRTPTAAASPPAPPPQVPLTDLPTLAVPPPRAGAFPTGAARPTAASSIEGPAPSLKEPVDDAEKTRFFPPPISIPVPAAAKPVATTSPAIAAAAAPAGLDDPDQTNFVPPPAPPAAVPVRSTSVPTLTSEDDDKTRVVSPPARALPSPPPRQRPGQLEQPAARPQPRTTAPSSVRAKPRVAAGSWTFFVLVQVAALAAIVFLVTVIPVILWQQRALSATASSRASVLTNWLASNARSALEASTPGAVASAADEVSREPGVVSALILSPEGRVLAPSSRSTETIASLPGMSVKPGEVATLKQSWNGDLLETARPVSAEDRALAAIAWITYRPERQEAGSAAAVLALPVVMVLVAAWLSSWFITRKTIGALTVLNEDFELALTGRLDQIGDPLGVKPVSDLAGALNSLIVKLRGGASLDSVRSADAPKPSAVVISVASVPPMPEPAVKDPVRLDARIVANAQFRVTEASRDCAALIGVRPDALLGQHLIDAIPDRAIADAVLQSLSALGASGEHRTMVPAGANRGDVSIVVSRDGRDKPLTIVISRASEVTV